MRIVGVMVLWIGLGAQAWAQETAAVRFLNGAVAKGEVVAIKPEGIEMQLGGTNKVYPWAAFSPGTRFRLDPMYRANLADAQRGRPMRSWTNPPAKEVGGR